ncbi:AmmeMemoRadiSam system protein B [bacterium]|nr:AmmeMemoRadiSam system protein B [bacterium]
MAGEREEWPGRASFVLELIERIKVPYGGYPGHVLLKGGWAALILLMTFALSCAGEKAKTSEDSPKPVGEVRSPAVSGMFYPGNAFTLKNEVDEFLQRVERKAIQGKLIALIAPHAGYRYSGQVAAFAYKQLEGKKIDTIILIGPSHRTHFSGVSVGNYGYYQTPLGKVAVDTELAERMMEGSKLIDFYPPAHQQEHCLEVQIPFLQRILTKFKILPLLTGSSTLEISQELSQVLLKEIKGKNILLIASTDLSHYYPYQEACRLDKRTLKVIEGLDGELLYREMASGRAELCGGAAVVATLLTAKQLGADNVKILKYANSGDRAPEGSGDKSRVVGYAAIAIYKAREGKMEREPLNETAQKELLRIARTSIESYVKEGKTAEFEVKEPVFQEKRGVFITITKDGALRGCIGRHESDLPLYQTVAQMAVSAACRDPRFPPLRNEELSQIKIKVSVYLMSPTEIKSLEEFDVGKHGIIVEKGHHSATYLPEVATEQGWTKEETLSSLCQKAGLPPDAWREGTKFSIYATQVFGE